MAQMVTHLLCKRESPEFKHQLYQTKKKKKKKKKVKAGHGDACLLSQHLGG
jgi:hypothetical protein